METPPEVSTRSQVEAALSSASLSASSVSLTAENRTGVWPAQATKPASPYEFDS